nr:MAG TPA: hypothetical protein [Caudoviricetes sp.]
MGDVERLSQWRAIHMSKALEQKYKAQAGKNR